jgi:hypothetical protein
MKTTRRLVLSAVATVVCFGVWGASDSSTANAAEVTTQPTLRYALEIDGFPVFVAPTPTATGNDLTFKTSTQLNKSVYDWLQNFVSNNALLTKNLSLTTASYDYAALSRLDMAGAVITEVAFPALDPNSKDRGYITITVRAATARVSQGDGSSIRARVGVEQKAWTLSDYRVEIAGAPNAHVSHVDAFVVKRGAPTAANALSTNGPAPVMPRIAIYVPLSDAAVITSWQQNVALPSTNPAKRGTNAKMIYLTPTATEIFTINLASVAPFSVTTDTANQRIKVEMSGGAMSFAVPATALP